MVVVFLILAGMLQLFRSMRLVLALGILDTLGLLLCPRMLLLSSVRGISTGKNVFALLSEGKKHWIDIDILKYGNLYPWPASIKRNSSLFFKMLSKTTESLRVNCSMIVCNPNHTELWKDP